MKVIPYGNSRSSKLRTVTKTRTGCEACLRINYNNDSEEWIVRLVKVIHNHSLVTPSKRSYLQTNREIPKRERELFQSLKATNVAPSKQFEIASTDYGGYGNMAFCQSDFPNMRRDDRMIVERQDVDLVVERFEANKEWNDSFYYSSLRHESGSAIFE